MKKLIAFLLCISTLLCVLAGCGKKDQIEDEDMGAYVNMYISDPVYNFDPALAYTNESTLKIVSLLYENLFVLDKNGEPQKSLVKSYKINKKENTMLITLRNDAFWTDGTVVSANDVVFAWQRILDSSRSFDAASLLYNVKNAKAAKEGNVPSIDDVGIKALNKSKLQIEFEEGVDYDSFIRNLASYALCPLRSDVVERTEKEIDWAKSTTTIVTSGPFRIRSVSYDPASAGITLERNPYYHRNYMKDKVDKAVTPYRLIIDYTKSAEDIYSDYENGELFYVGDIPFALRSKYTAEEWADIATVFESQSTHSYIFNTNAVVRYYNASEFAKLSGKGSVYNPELAEGTDGDKIFAKTEVRKALSLVLDRADIANTVVFADPASGLVPNTVFEENSHKKTFRSCAGEGLSANADITAAKNLLSAAGVNPTKYMFAISVPAYDAVHLEIAKKVQAAWTSLGFHVAINAIENIENTHVAISMPDAPIANIKDDIFTENYIDGKFEVAAIDYSALSTDAFSVLAPFAKGFTGGASILEHSTEFFVATHKSGFDNDDYNNKIAEAYAEKNLSARAKLLHEAEEILMNELPIIPVVFNKNAVLQTKDFSKVKYDCNGIPCFTKTKLKNYKDYIPEEE